MDCLGWSLLCRRWACPGELTRWLICATLLAVFVVALASVARADADDHCAAGQTPMFHAGFAALSDRLGATMGAPTTCEYPDPGGTGDVEQNTTTGLAFWRKSTNTPTFTNGFDHWALTPAGITRWTGADVDPPPERVPTRTGFAPFVGFWSGHGRALEVLDTGEASINYRTYRVCGQEPPPCDTVTGNAIIDGGRVQVQLESRSATTAAGSVVSSADPAYPAGTRATFKLDPNDALDVQIGDAAFANFCGRAAPISYCGA
jgi:hypothetical protein